MDNSADQTKAAFHSLLDTLREAEQVFRDPAKGISEQGVIDGYRHLAHLLSYGFDCYLDSDPDRPEFIPLASPRKKILGDNVDSIYHFTQIRGGRSYRIRGKRGNDCYLSFCVYGGKPDGEWSDRIVANINHESIRFDESNRFDIVLTPGEGGVGRFKIDADSVCVIVRQYFFDPEHAVPAEFSIIALEEAPAPGPMSDSDMARRIRSVATFIRETCQIMPLPATFNKNVLGDPFGFRFDQRSWGTPDNIYSIGTFDLKPGQAMEVRGSLPPCCYWGIQTWNNYMQSYDYRYHRVSLNSGQIQLETDGSYTVIVSPEDPGVPNWVGTAGHREGILFCRWLLAKSSPEKPECSVVRLEQIAGR